MEFISLFYLVFGMVDVSEYIPNDKISMDIQVSEELKIEIYKGSHIRLTHLVPNLAHITVTKFNMYFSVQVLNSTYESGSF